jgi:methyltransferase-like protein/SAM-dependent methyltransferase
MAPPPPRTSYDELPYLSLSYSQTHPNRLATVATLLGMRPAPVERCRVLELGCAAGGNLIPLALTLPDSTFVGIDLSRVQIAQGQKTVDALGLRNIQLLPLSILDVGEEFGLFDYIICHGVYSWVPAPVQDKILDVCARRLTPDGVGYVSYNTYPGWHMRGMIRAMMGLHDRRFRDKDPLTRVGQARALLDFLARSAVNKDSPYSRLLQEHLELLAKSSDSYLFHEHLEECNDPIYFIEFCERLAARGLRYLGEAEFHVMVPSTSFPSEVRDELNQLAANLLEMEQYMDLLRNRLFRQTLVCHSHVRPCYDVRAELLTRFHVASPAKAVPPGPDLASPAPVEFKGRNDLVLTTSAPVVKAALAFLGETWPAAVPFDRLRAEARARLGPGSPDDPELAREDTTALARALLTAYASAGHALVDLWMWPPSFVVEVSERPVASTLARLQAAGGRHVTNLRHETVHLGELDRQLVPLLDGSRDRPALVQALLGRWTEGVLQMAEDEKPVTDRTRAENILTQLLHPQLAGLAKVALLSA